MQMTAKVRGDSIHFLFCWSLGALSQRCWVSQAKWKIFGEVWSVSSVPIYMWLSPCLSWLLNDIISYGDLTWKSYIFKLKLCQGSFVPTTWKIISSPLKIPFITDDVTESQISDHWILQTEKAECLALWVWLTLTELRVPRHLWPRSWVYSGLHLFTEKWNRKGVEDPLAQSTALWASEVHPDHRSNCIQKEVGCGSLMWLKT